MIESLEPRTLMSVSLTSKGTLVVTGGGANDTIVVSVNPKNGVVTVNKNDRPASFAGKAVKRVLVAGNSGHDRIHIDPGLNRACTVTGGSGADIIEGNAGSVLIGGSGNDKLVAQPFKFVLRGGTFGVDNATWQTVTVSSANVSTAFAAASYMSGGDGSDTLVSSTGGDDTRPDPTISGGAGRDLLVASGGSIEWALGENGVVEGLGNLSGIEVFSGNFVSATDA